MTIPQQNPDNRWRARGLALLALPLLLGACTATPPPAPDAKLKPLSAYAKDPFVPVNLYVNSNEQLSGREQALTEHIAEQLAASGAFLRVDRGAQRWVYTLQLRYRITPGTAARDLGLRALGLLTLGLLPVRVPQRHEFRLELFLEPDPVAKLEYEETVLDTVSLYGLADSNADERAAADLLLERAAADLSRKKILPTAREYKAPPAKPRRRKAQPL